MPSSLRTTGTLCRVSPNRRLAIRISAGGAGGAAMASVVYFGGVCIRYEYARREVLQIRLCGGWPSAEELFEISPRACLPARLPGAFGLPPCFPLPAQCFHRRTSPASLRPALPCPAMDTRHAAAGSAAAASACSRCHNSDTNYLDGEARLSYSARCGHGACRRCLSELFGRHRSARCPVPSCGETLTRADFSEETREATEYRREKEVRHRLGLIFNRTAADFGSADAAGWNDYTERVEGFVAALVAGAPREREAVEAAIEAYKGGHARAIARNNARADAAAKRANEALRSERGAREAAVAKTEGVAAAQRAAAERLRARLSGVVAAAGGAAPPPLQPVVGVGGGGGRRDSATASAAAASSARAELVTLRARLLSAAAALAPTATPSAAASALEEGTGQMYVPCAHVFPPRFLGEPNAAASGGGGGGGGSATTSLSSAAAAAAFARGAGVGSCVAGRMRASIAAVVRLRACGLRPFDVALSLPSGTVETAAAAASAAVATSAVLGDGILVGPAAAMDVASGVTTSVSTAGAGVPRDVSTVAAALQSNSTVTAAAAAGGPRLSIKLRVGGERAAVAVVPRPHVFRQAGGLGGELALVPRPRRR